MRGGALLRKISNPILDLLRQGITPEKIALSIALGLTLGVTPVLGSTTLLCLLAALALRLNLPAIQMVNYIALPLQCTLLVPFIRAGEWMFSAQPARISLEQIVGLIRADIWTAIVTLWTATLHALAAWLALGSLGALLIYAVLTPVLRRLGEASRAGSQ
ncbi:MAG: DUF2062 domain-containing protein [Acidobacteria bacterium]|nr:DUF2062 domain-containing protein [Acidobacteriota bacterium]